ncbi:unnamed protein product, partial [Pelagomonas calceolata]
APLPAPRRATTGQLIRSALRHPGAERTPRARAAEMRLVLLLAAAARALQPCSTPVLVDGAERFVECGGPHAVDDAVFAFLGGLNDTARVGCATEACVEAAPKKGATCSDEE